jgi:hypothetical protein
MFEIFLVTLQSHLYEVKISNANMCRLQKGQSLLLKMLHLIECSRNANIPCSNFLNFLNDLQGASQVDPGVTSGFEKMF